MRFSNNSALSLWSIKGTSNWLGGTKSFWHGLWYFSACIYSIAILGYLSQKYNVPDHWYPRHDLRRRARVDEYTQWHHVNTRFQSASLFAELVSIYCTSLVHHMINPWKSIAQPRRDYETIVPGAGHYHFLLDRVTSLGKLWHQSQFRDSKLMSHCYRRKQINVMWCT